MSEQDGYISAQLAAELLGRTLVHNSCINVVDNILQNPNLRSGKTPQEVEAIVGNTPGWRIETLGKGSSKGQGWVLREYTAEGNPTGQMLRWHPGGGTTVQILIGA